MHAVNAMVFCDRWAQNGFNQGVTSVECATAWGTWDLNYGCVLLTGELRLGAFLSDFGSAATVSAGFL